MSASGSMHTNKSDPPAGAALPKRARPLRTTSGSNVGWIQALCLLLFLFASGISSNSQSGCSPAPLGISSWWPADGHTDDLVGNHNATLINGASDSAPGLVGLAFDFDGTNDHASFGTESGNFHTNDFAIAFWFRTTSDRQEAVLSKRSNCRVDNFWEILVNYGFPGSLFFCVMEAGRNNEIRLLYPGRLNDGLYHHVVAVRRGREVSLYVDGESRTSGVSPQPTRLVNDAPVRAAWTPCEGTDFPFTGTIDELQFWSRALDSNEVATVFGAGSAGLCHTFPRPSTLGDLNVDEEVNVADLALLVNHITETQRFPSRFAAYGDINQDGRVDAADVNALALVILDGPPFRGFPTNKVLNSSPASGASQVAVTRETIIQLVQPLKPGTTVSSNQFYAEFEGRRLPTRIEISADRRTLTLFYLAAGLRTPLPGNARIRVVLNGDGLMDFADRFIDLDGDGQAGGQIEIDFDTLNLNPVPIKGLSGRVFASELNQSNSLCLSNVLITADGLEDTVRVVTDAHGNFTLTNAPAGRFFVHVDGTTHSNLATGIRFPDMAYYPVVGKEWESVPGEEVNVGNIYLPLVQQGTLRQVSPTEPTVVTFPTNVVADHPELEGVAITVQPNSLFRDDGTRGGSVGIAPVPPDRLPGKLPPGLDFPLVITVQTDGAQNFTTPVPACFPNLQHLTPGSKSALWSFNHDIGQWEVIGPMTVSGDGRLICTDPGVGIRAPGWHGTTPAGSTQGGASGSGGDNDDDGGGCPKSGAIGSEPSGACESGPATGGNNPGKNKCNPVYLFSGEKVEQVTDLRIPGVGLDFVWQRTYRSKHAPNTAQGNGWDFSYNLCLIPSGRGIRVLNGAGRDDLFLPLPFRGDTLAHNSHPSALSTNADGSFALVFPDQTKAGFAPFNGAPKAGKLESLVDRNGNTMRFFYDPTGRLSRVRDTLDRDVTLAYTREGFIESITDFAGRSVRYAYYGSQDAGGKLGDLKSVTTPAVTGTPNGNDYPNGKTTSYTYSKGFADERLNHNLLTITDGRRNDPGDATYGQGPYLINVYSPITNPDDLDFDRVIRQIRAGDTTDFTYVPQPRDSDNGIGYVKVIVRDRVGNVSEHFYDAGNRLVCLREFTGRANPNQPTTETANRPTGKLRPEDPAFFETRYEYNRFFRQTRIIHPNGNITENVYESDLLHLPENPPSPRSRNNLRLVRQLPGSHTPAGDQAVIENAFEYSADFGCGGCGFNFVTRQIDGRGNDTVNQYDSRGNLTNRIHRIASITEQFEYNARGQLTKHILPDNGSGHYRLDVTTYYESGPMRGYLASQIIDSGGFNLTTRWEYDAVGNVTRRIDPRGHDTVYAVNQINQTVRELSPEVVDGTGIRYRKDYFYDANNNLSRLEIENRNAYVAGESRADGSLVGSNATWTTTYGYETLNHLVEKREEAAPGRFILTEFRYDPNRNLSETCFGEATAGRQPDNLIRRLYDERDLPFREIRGAGGTSASTTEFIYDANKNLVLTRQGIEDAPRLTTNVYDGFNRLVLITDPMGNLTSYGYDANHNRISERVEGELLDAIGFANNVLLSQSGYVFDEEDRLVRQETAFFDSQTLGSIGDGIVGTDFAYSANSQPLATTNDNGHVTFTSYDTANRKHIVTDAKTNQVTFTYDTDSNVTLVSEDELSDVDGHVENFKTRYSHDNLNRLTSQIDNVGNITRWGFDARGNRTIQVDALTNRVLSGFDGLNRLTETRQLMTDTGDGRGNLIGQIVTRQIWDDTSRLTSQIDDNNNATTYLYDGLNRQLATVFADNTGQTNGFDVHDNVRRFTDANRNDVSNSYDLNNRRVRRDITPGPGVSAETTFENFRWDGLSRLVSAEDNDSLVTRSYDSLSHLSREVQNGHTNRAVYDGLGNMSRCVYPSGGVISTSYDELERKKTISDTNGLIARYDYVGPHRVSRRDYGNGTRCDYAYDGITGVPNPAGDLSVRNIIRTQHSRIADGGAIDDRTYRWNQIGVKTQEHDFSLPTAQQREYAYDSAYRLVGSTNLTVVVPAGVIRYDLDGVGNRRAVSGPVDAGAYSMSAATPEPADRQLNQYTSTPFDTRRNDRNGNLAETTFVGRGTNTLTWNYANRLVADTNLVRRYIAHHAYDALGRRFRVQVTGTTALLRQYLSFENQELEEIDGDQRVVVSYVIGDYIDDVLSAKFTNGNVFVHANALFSAVALTDGAGAVLEKFNYDDYGYPRFSDFNGTSHTSSTIGYAPLFTGRRFEPWSGLYQYRSRFYDSSVGRFISRDAVDESDSLNLFQYCQNSPVNFVDPFGLIPAAAVPVVEGAAAAGAAAARAATAYCSSPAGAHVCAGMAAGIVSAIIEPVIDFPRPTPYPPGTVTPTTTSYCSATTSDPGHTQSPSYSTPDAATGSPPDDDEPEKPDRMGDNRAQNRQFDAAIRKAEQHLGRKLTKGQRRIVHDEISKQGLGYHDIVQVTIDIFGK